MSAADEMVEFARAREAELATPSIGPRPRRRVAILTCMDARIELSSLLGIEPGDAHVIRNAGGLVTDDAIRSLSVSQRLLATNEIVVVMHEDCGLQGASEELAIDDDLPPLRIGAFDAVENALRDGLAKLRSCGYLAAREAIRGFVFDPRDGSLREVVPAETGS